MESKINYTLVGFFVLFFSAAVIITGYWFTAGRHGEQYLTYLVYMDEAVSGLSVQAPVTYSGVEVGYVSDIDLNPYNLRQVRLTLQISKKTPITTSTVATLNSRGITGITYVGLRAKTVAAPLLLAMPGQQYPIIPSEPSVLNQLDTVLRNVSSNIEAVGNSLQKVLSKKNREAISRSLTNIANVTDTLDDRRHDIDRAIRQFPDLVKQTQDSMTSFENMAKRFSTTAETLSQQAIPSTVDLLNRIDTIAAHLEKVTGELEKNPTILIRGRKPTAKGPGE